jgi:WD40 repeat protein
MINHYQVGGSLSTEAPCYVFRQADQELLEYLQKGDFCYVFNSRQMGKSSLLVKTNKILQQQGWQTATIDMTMIGSDDVTAEQWYFGIISRLWYSFRLHKNTNIDLWQWYDNQQNISLVQIFSHFIDQIIFPNLPEQNIIIFIDEIDSTLSLDFAVDDFFAFIRSCYNQRSIDANYQRLTFAIFGVATPTDLIRDKRRTPFNIGHAVNLTGFQLGEAQPLIAGLPETIKQPDRILQEILYWTDGQPFLTQKICQLLTESLSDQELSAANISPQTWVKNLICQRVIENWESQDEPEHLRTIQDRLNYYQERKNRLLGIYQQVLQGKKIAVDDSQEQTELILSGLVTKYQGYLRVKNLIYSTIFNEEWVSHELNLLRPYSESFTAWIKSAQQDQSRLLRGQALKDAQMWLQGKSLSDLDYQFLASSTEIDRQEIEQKLEAARIKSIELQLIEQKKYSLQQQQNVRLQRLFLILLGVAFLFSSGLGIFTFMAYRRASISEIQALITSTQGLFASYNQLDAMLAGIDARRKLKNLGDFDPEMVRNTKTALNQTVYGNQEFNRLVSHRGSVFAVAISPDRQLIATSGNDKTLKIWASDGRLLKDLSYKNNAYRLVFSADGQIIVGGMSDGSIFIWRSDGTLIRKIKADSSIIWGITISPDQKFIASASSDRTVKLWTLDGKLWKTFTGHQAPIWNVAFSPSGKTLISGSMDQTVKLWDMNGQILKTMTGHKKPVWDIAFCTEEIFVSVSGDETARIWHKDTGLVKTLQNNYPLYGVDCQGELIATSGTDGIIKIWNTDGTLLQNLRQHKAIVREVAISRDAQVIATASDDGVVKLWRQNQYFLNQIYAYKMTIWDVASHPSTEQFASANVGDGVKLWGIDGALQEQVNSQVLLTESSQQSGELNNKNIDTNIDSNIDTQIVAVTFTPDGRHLLTGSMNSELKLWSLGQPGKSKTQLLKTMLGHKASIFSVAVSPDQKIIASGSNDQTIKLWDMQGNLLKTIPTSQEIIWRLAFSPDGQFIASSGSDVQVKLWNRDGKFLRSFDHQGVVWGLAFHPDKNILITSSRDDQLRFWNYLDGKLEKSILTNSGGLTRVAISSHGNLIATAGVDNTVKLWNTDGNLLAILPGHKGMVLSLAFAHNNKSLMSGGDDGVLIIWDLPKILSINSLYFACNWVRDYLANGQDLSDQQRRLCDGMNN